MQVGQISAADILATVKDVTARRVRRMFSEGKLWQRRAALAGFAVVAAGIVHIITTLIAPSLSAGNAFERLSRSIPVNRFVLLPMAKPGAQVLPFQSPVNRLSVCRFDAREGPVSLSATLPEAGWSLSVYSESGDGLYTLTGQPDRRTDAAVVLIPAGERFIGRSVEPQPGVVDFAQVTVPTGRGLVVVRAPVKGKGFTYELDQDLARASCKQEKF